MRLNINLASQKYEDTRRFYARWLTAIACAAALTMILLILTWMNYANAEKSNQRIKEQEAKVSALEKERAAAESVTNRPENHDVNTQKNYWNRQIARRGFSWTQLFNDLQRIMPARAYVSSVHPELTLDNHVKLTLVIMSDTHSNGLELVQKMEKSPRFRGFKIPTIDAETTEKNQRGGAELYKFDIVTYYNPAESHPATKEGL